MATVGTQDEFKAAVTAQEAEIIVANDISLTSVTTIPYTVTIKGGTPGVSLFSAITAGTTRDMLSVSNLGDLTIEDIIFDAEGRDNTLVQVNGGRFTMKDGSILRGVNSMTGRRAVYVGTTQSAIGGTFIMDGGTITENECSEAVNCFAGTVIMNGNASISGNKGTGILVSRHFVQPYQRGKLIMTGNSSVTGNTGVQPAGGVTIYGSDFVMGENEGDAPRISGNQNPYYGGGLHCDANCTFTMGFNAEISDNHAGVFGGGASLEDTIVHISGNAVIKNNTSDGPIGGVILSTEEFSCSAIIEGNAEISGNVCTERGGGIFIQRDATLQIRGNASVHNNKAENGGGIHLNNSVPTLIGAEDSAPQIIDNEATEFGGGIFISSDSSLELMGRTNISGNTAEQGNGIYKMGKLLLSQAPSVTDGLFFDDLDIIPGNGDGNAGEIAPDFEFIIGEGDNAIRLEPMRVDNEPAVPREAFAADLGDKYCSNVPIIADMLTGAKIQLESSGHVSPRNVRLVIAENCDDYPLLGESDRAAWLIPTDFAPGHCVVLNDEHNWVLIDLETYHISYYHLYGCDNPNPTEYDVSMEFPIALQKPGDRPGYDFVGWFDGEGNRVTEIAEGTTGDLVLIAVWRRKERSCLKFEGNAPCVTEVPQPICVVPGEMVHIPYVIPEKPYHCFVEWNTDRYGKGEDYSPGDAIVVLKGGVTLYALWRPICDYRHKRMPVYCPSKGC